MQKTGLPTQRNFNPSNLAIWIKMPEYRWLIDLGDDYKNMYLQVKSYLDRHGVDIDIVDINWLHNLLRKLKSKYVKEYFIYSNLPHDFREVSTYRDFLGFLSQNSMKDKQILGITLPYGVSMSQPLDTVFKNQLDSEVMDVLTFINYCFSIINDKDLIKEVSELKINSSILMCKSNCLSELLDELLVRWEMKPELAEIVVPHIICLKKSLNEELRSAPWLMDTYYYSFVKNQKMVGNIWLGKGILYVNLPRIKLEFEILNTKVESIRSNNNNFTFKQFEIAYVNSVLINANLGRLDDMFGRIDHSNWEKLAIGLDTSGSVSISQNRHLKLSFTRFSYIRTIVNKASRLGNCEIKINKNFSYDVTNKHELYENEKCTLNVFKIDPHSMLQLLISMYDNDDNRRIVESKGELFKQYLTMFVGTASGVEMNLHIDQLFDLLQSSKIYKILSDLVNSDKLSQKSMRPRKHIYPGQEGGLLNALIEYKGIDESFGFDFNRILSPEMMALKSSQPEAFMSNLVTNIREKFNQLYNGEDRESIRRDLIKLSGILDNDQYHKKLLALLTNWGYIGVMGALDEMNFTKRKENFKTIRFRGKNELYSGFNEKALIDFLNALSISTKEYNYFNKMDLGKAGLGIYYCRSWQDFQKTCISLVHSYVLNSFSIKSKYLTHMPNIEFLKLSSTINLLLQSEDFCESMMKNMQDNPMLMLILVDKKSCRDLMIMLETLLNDYAYNHCQDLELRYDIPVQHDHLLMQPYTLTKNLLKNTKFGFSLKGLYFHGFLSRESKNFFTKNSFFVFEDKLTNVNFSLGKLDELYLPMNKYYYIKNKMTEETEDSDEYYDITMEMESEEPDLDELDPAVENRLDADYTRRLRLRYKNNLSYMPHFDVKVFFMPDLKSNPGKLSYIRNSATTIMIITNLYIADLVEQKSNCLQIFRRENIKWHNETLIDPDCLLYYIMDYNDIDKNLWCSILDAKAVDKDQLHLEMSSAPSNLIIVDSGEVKVVSKYMTLEEKMELMRRDEKEIAEESVDTIVEVEKEMPEILKKLKSDGYDEGFIKLVESKLKSFTNTGIKDIMKSMIEKFLNSAKLMEAMKKETKKGTEKVLQDLEDVSQSTKIFEVASVFSVGVPNKSSHKNKSLKDPALRAEINSLYENLIDFLLSGVLSISPKEFQTTAKFCKAMRRYSIAEKVDRDKKVFLIDLTQLIMNDAYFDVKGEHDYIFSSIRDKLTNKIVTDEDDDDYNFANTYSKESGLGKIYYKW